MRELSRVAFELGILWNITDYTELKADDVYNFLTVVYDIGGIYRTIAEKYIDKVEKIKDDDGEMLDMCFEVYYEIQGIFRL